MKITRHMIEARFLHLRKLLKKPEFYGVVSGKPTVGAWALDFSSTYGGYQIEENVEGGGVHIVVGRLPAKEIFSWLNGAIFALQL